MVALLVRTIHQGGGEARARLVGTRQAQAREVTDRRALAPCMPLPTMILSKPTYLRLPPPS